jgi:hypothetical protein
VSARVASSSSGGTAGEEESLDDVAAQRHLRGALESLQTAPFEFLGVGADPTAGQARAAFLALTKTYHPTKFARFSPNTVRLANEVFLALKSVCEGVGRPAVAPARPAPARQTQISPAGRREPAPSASGSMLAIARISGETAPLLFTALNNQFFSVNMNQPMPSLPVVIFQFALSPYEEWQKLAWTGALLITVTVLALSVIARSLTAARKSS